MSEAGPQLAHLLHRLADCPAEFLLSPDKLNVTALACDHFRAIGQSIPDRDQRRAMTALAPETRRLLAIVLWLLHDDWFLARPELAEATGRLLQSDALRQLAGLVRAEKVIQDPDRREELVRLCLTALELRPEGETPGQAADRLNTLDSVERERLIRQTRQAERRARAVRAAMARRRAEEAAARYSPE